MRVVLFHPGSLLTVVFFTSLICLWLLMLGHWWQWVASSLEVWAGSLSSRQWLSFLKSALPRNALEYEMTNRLLPGPELSNLLTPKAERLQFSLHTLAARHPHWLLSFTLAPWWMSTKVGGQMGLLALVVLPMLKASQCPRSCPKTSGKTSSANEGLIRITRC